MKRRARHGMAAIGEAYCQRRLDPYCERVKLSLSSLPLINQKKRQSGTQTLAHAASDRYQSLRELSNAFADLSTRQRDSMVRTSSQDGRIKH
jgi:lipid II:glycine glycyltransferase (peptidoglycan interpeptide bridge formation enzyme)